MKRFVLIYTSALLMLLYSCSRVNPDKILHQAEDVVASYPDSALGLLGELPSPRTLNSENRARYGWIKGFAHDQKKYSLENDSLLVYSLNYYKQLQDTSRWYSLYKLVTKFYQVQKDYDNGNRILEEGIEWAKNLKDSAIIADFYHQKALMLLEQDRYSKEAEKYLRISLRYKENANVYHLIGARFTVTDSIVYFNKKSVDMSLGNKDTISAVFFLRDMASVLSQRKRYGEAKGMLRQSLLLSPTSPGPLLIMSYLYLDLGEIDSADYYLIKAKESLTMLRSQGYFITSSAENSVALAQTVIDYSRNKSFNHMPINRYNDSVFYATHNQYRRLQTNIESRHHLEKENMQLIIHQQQSRLWLLAILLVIVILGGTTYLYTRKRKQKLLEAEEKIETLNHLLNEATENTTEMNDSRFFKKILLQQLGFIRLVAAVPTTANQELLKQMANITNKDTPGDTLLAWDDLYPIIDSIYNHFQSNLKECYGNILIEKEIQLCCLLCAGFTTKEINVVTRQSIPTIYQRKTTIRKKLGIGEKEDIISFLRQQFQG